MKGKSAYLSSRALTAVLRTAIAAGALFSCWTAAAQMDAAAPQPHGWSAAAVQARVPQSARLRKNPFEGNEREATAGEKLFEEHCTECHGQKAAGTRYGPSLLQEEVQQASPGTLFWILSNGVVRRGMPVWSKLPEPQRWQLVTFLQSLRAHSTKPAMERHD